MADALVELFKHHLWANEKLLGACDRLSDEHLDASVGGVYGSIRLTLLHLFASETRYVAAIHNQPRPDELHEEKPFPGLAALKAYARTTGEDLIALAQTVGPDDRMQGQNRGESYDLPLSIPLAQAINHRTEHRANITTIMSAVGLEAPPLDVWEYARERSTRRNV